MELVLLEHKKLWRKKITKICVLLCFLYIVIVGNILTFQWFGFGSSNDYTSSFGNNFDGYSVIKSSQEYAEEFGDVLDDKTLQQLVRDYQRMDAAGMNEELGKTDWRTINSWLSTLYPELEDSSNPKLMISYVNPDKLVDFYGKRQAAIETFLDISGQTGAERTYLLKMNEAVELPMSYGWVRGWSEILGSMVADLGTVMALFLAIVLSPMFAGEWYNNTGSLVLTTKNGWQRIAAAKIITGFVFSIELFALLVAGSVCSQLYFTGMKGWDMPIQLIKLIAIAPMNMLEALIYEYVFALLGVIGFTGVVMLLSAMVKSNVFALIGSLAIVYVPTVISEYLPYNLQKVVDLIPLVGSSTDIFRTNTFQIFGMVIWSPYLLLIVPPLIGIVCVPFAVKQWARRLKV